jgi:hypothetical protein
MIAEAWTILTAQINRYQYSGIIIIIIITLVTIQIKKLNATTVWHIGLTCVLLISTPFICDIFPQENPYVQKGP